MPPQESGPTAGRARGALGDRPQTAARLPDPRHRKTAAPQHRLEGWQATPGHGTAVHDPAPLPVHILVEPGVALPQPLEQPVAGGLAEVVQVRAQPLAQLLQQRPGPGEDRPALGVVGHPQPAERLLRRQSGLAATHRRTIAPGIDLPSTRPTAATAGKRFPDTFTLF